MRRSRLRAVTGAAALVCTGAVLLARQQTPPQQQRPPVFRGESVLVTVDVYPHRDGRIVEGLRAEDFQVLEDGKPQAVESIEFVRIEPSLSESERRDPDSTREMLALAADPHNRVFVVFLDKLHVTVDGSFATRRPMVDSLNRIIGPNDLFGVMTQNTDPRALTLGRRLLSVEEQLTKYWAWGERYRLGLDPDDPMEESLKSCFEYKPPTLLEPLPPWFISDNGQQRLLYQLLVDRRREDRTLTSLENLVDRLGGLRDARTVTLVVTEGWRLFREDRPLADQVGVLIGAGADRLPPVGSSGGTITLGDKTGTANRSYTYTKQCNDELVRLAMLDDERRMQELIRRANRANVSFYPINPAGLTSVDMPVSAERLIGGTQGGKPIVARLGPADPLEDGRRLRGRADALRTLAQNTDGIAIVDTNDIGAGMKRIVEDVSAYYLLGYYSTNTTHDGRYRRIEVKAKQPAVSVRARRGYIAPSNKPTRDAFTPAPAGPEPPKGMDAALGELARLRPSADLFTRGTITGDTVDVAVEIASTRAGAAPWNTGADVQVVLTPDGGAPLPAVSGRIDPNTRGLLLKAQLGSDAKSVRVVSKVSAGGESIEDTVEIPRGSSGLLGDAILYRGRPAATSPLRPVADLQFRRTERVHAEWPVTGDIDRRSARLLSRTGQPLAIPVGVTERDVDGRRVVAADLNLAPLSTGEYVIELTAGRGTDTAMRLIAFRVVQ